MGLFDKTKPQIGQPPVINNTSNVLPPNVNLVDDVDYKAARTANEATVIASAAALAAAEAAKEAKEQADRAKEEADSIIDDYEGWQDAMDAAEEALAKADDAFDEAKSAVRAADIVYYGFMNMNVTAESIPADQDADAIWTPAKNTLDFKIPKGLDGTIEGLANAPVITDVDKTDYIMVVDHDDNTVKKAEIDDFLDLTVKTVNGYGPDDKGNVDIKTGDEAPVLYLGESVLMVSSSAPVGCLPADGSIQLRANFPDLWKAIESKQLASVTEEEWQAGQNDVFSTGDGSTSFRLPLFTDNGEVVMTQGDFTLNGDITLAGTARVPMTLGTSIHDGDFRVQDSSRGVYTDVYVVNRMAGEGTDNAYAAVGFVDRRDNKKTLGGMFADELTNDIGLLSNLGDANLAAQVGDVKVVASAGDVNVKGTNITLDGKVSLTNGDVTLDDLTATTITTTGAINAGGNVNTNGVNVRPSSSAEMPNAILQMTFDTSSKNGAFIDMASGKGHTDFDVRLNATNGTASSSGGGDLAITAANVNISSNLHATGGITNLATTYTGELRPSGDVWISGNTISGWQKAYYLHDSANTQFGALAFDTGRVNVGDARYDLQLFSGNIIQAHGNVVVDEGRGFWQTIGGNNTRAVAYENGALQLNSNANYGCNITCSTFTVNGAPHASRDEMLELIHSHYNPIIEELRSELSELRSQLQEKLNA